MFDDVYETVFDYLEDSIKEFWDCHVFRHSLWNNFRDQAHYIN